MNIDPNKVHDSEVDEQGNFKETLCVANILRWLTVPAAIAAIAWMMGYFH